MKLMCKTAEATKLTTWANEPKYSDFEKDYTMASASHEMFLKDLEDYRTTLAGGKPIKVRKGKSSVRPLLVRKNNEWKYSQLEEPFLSTKDIVKLRPFGPDDAARVRQANVLINHYWAVDINRIALVGEIARCLTDEGTVIVKNGWYTEKEKYIDIEEKPLYASPGESLMLMSKMVQEGSMTNEQAQAMLETGEPMLIGSEKIEIEKERIIKNHPIHEVCELERLIVDPTCKGDMSKARFITHDYDVDYSILVKDKFDPKTGIGYYKNLDSIDFKKDWESFDEYDSAKVTSFIFSDRARKKVRIHEYWGYWDIDGSGIVKPIVASWIGTTLVRLEENPFPHKRLPFSATTYMPVRGQFHGEPDAKLLKENQEAIGKMTRAVHDITSTRAVGQKLIMEDTFGSQAEWNAWEMGNDARYRSDVNIDKAVKTISVEPIDSSIFQVIDMQQKDAESLSGNPMYNHGVQAPSGSATGIKAATDSSSRRELSILRRMSSQLFKDMIAQDIANMQMFASPEEIVRITDEEFVTVKLEDIQGNFDIDIDVSTPAKDQETADTLSFILQAAGDTIDPKIKNIVFADILRLKGRPDLAKTVEEYEPQPSKEEVAMRNAQMSNLELENKLLQMKIAEMAKGIEEADSRIKERNTRSAENIEADVILKKARAEEHAKKAEYLSSQTDMLDADFVDRTTGEHRKREVEDQQFREDSKNEIEMAKLATQLKTKNKEGK